MLAQLSQCVSELQQTNSSIEKVAILRRYPALQPLLAVVLDPLQTTGVTRAGVLKYEAEKYPKFTREHLTYPTDIETLLAALVKRTLKGDQAKEAVVAFLRKQTAAHRELILGVVEKDLKTRLGTALYRQAYEASLPADPTKSAADPAEPETKTAESAVKKYQPALAYDLQKHLKYFQTSVAQGDPWLISRKLDGVRVQVWTTPPGQACSREGRPFSSLEPLLKLVLAHAPPGLVLDGEVCVLHPNGSESFKDAVSHVKRKQFMTRFCFCVFDVLTDEEFRRGQSTATLSARLKRANGLSSLFQGQGLQRVQLVDQVPYSESTLAQWQSRAEQQNWEGLMLRRDGPYAGKRTHDLLKVKRFHTEEYRIEGMSVGPYRVIDPRSGLEKVIETVTAVDINHKGFRVSVGSGFSLDERMRMYRNPTQTIGQVIAVQYFEESQDKHGNLSLRFPTFKGWHGAARKT